MVSFGDRLKKEREKRGMTLDEVSGTTKISVRLLKALEQEKFDQLPGGVFNKGFVRSYAKHLGLDDDAVVADYLEASGEASPPLTLADPTNVQQPSPWAQLPWGTLAGLVAVAVLLFAAWFYYSHRTHEKTAAPSVAPESEAASSSALPSPAPASPATASQPSSTSVPGAVSGTVGDSGEASSSPRSSPVPHPNPTASSGSGSFELSLRALDEVWISTALDGQPPAESTMEAGQSKTIRAVDKVVVRVGNPMALQVSMGGRKIPLHGVEGEPKTVTFTAAGLQASSGSPTKPN